MSLADHPRITPLSAYPAQRCPVRLQYDLLPPPGAVPVAVPAPQQERMEQGIVFEQTMLERLAALHPEAVLVPDDGRARAATVAAIEAQAPLVLGAVLPDDTAGSRTGRPDLLVRVDGGYLPADVKLHGITQAAKTQATKAQAAKAQAARSSAGSVGAPRWSPLERPWPSAATDEPALRLKSDREHDDALQLAHYWRMLEAHGYAAPGPARGAVLDRQQLLWWVDLDVPRRAVWWQEEPATWLQVYDHEFDFRRDVAAHTQRRIDGADLPPKVEPCWISECATCPWCEVCRAELVDGDHVSLLSGSTWDRFVEHRRRGVLTRRALADLDVPTALAVDTLSPAMWSRLEAAAPKQPVADVLDRRPDVVAAVGARTCGDFRARLDERTASYRTVKVGKLLPAIDEARVAVSGRWHRRRGVGALDLPPAMVEVDVDLESDPDGRVYLWGALPAVAGEAGEYVALDSYDQLTDEVEEEVFRRLLEHLAAQRELAARLGGQLRVYHWTAAELTAMRRIVAAPAVPGLPWPDELEAMIASEWVDLAAVFRATVLTGEPNGLKVVASSIGFDWDVEDAGGDQSMLLHAAAVSGDAAAVAWLRDYNRSDVCATWTVRRWLRDHADALPRIEDWRG